MSVSSMRVEKLHAELFDKMQEEQRVYIEDLKTKTPDEILNRAYEYLMREDFLDEMENINLNERQVRAMLASATPLADLYRKWTETEDPHKEDIKCIAFPPIEYQEVLRELRKIGINLNQLASKAHTLGFVDEREYRAESERLWRVVAELTKPMARGGVKFGNNKDMGC